MFTGIHEGTIPNGALFLLIFGLIFLMAIGTFISYLIKSLMVWSSNNISPIQDRYGIVIAKRIHLERGSLDEVNAHSSSTPAYFVLFEFEDHSRLELTIDRQQFGTLTEGEEGDLNFQGNRFMSFERRKAIS